MIRWEQVEEGSIVVLYNPVQMEGYTLGPGTRCKVAVVDRDELVLFPIEGEREDAEIHIYKSDSQPSDIMTENEWRLFTDPMAVMRGSYNYMEICAAMLALQKQRLR